jgi:hypothetical protein
MVNVQNLSRDPVVVQTSYSYFKLAPGDGRLVACTGVCGDSALTSDYVWIKSNSCQLLLQAPIPSSGPPMNGTFVVRDGPSVTFDPQPRQTFERAPHETDNPC